MDIVLTRLLVVTFTSIISVEGWGWKPYCAGLKSEWEVRKETKMDYYLSELIFGGRRTLGEDQGQGRVWIGDVASVAS